MSPNNLILENPGNYSVLFKYFTSKPIPKEFEHINFKLLNTLLKPLFYDTCLACEESWI